MTDQLALTAAVLAAPGENTPRLVFADWCDENGEGTRAAFIRRSISHGHDEAQAEFYWHNAAHSKPFEEWRAWGLPRGWCVTCYRLLHDQRGESHPSVSGVPSAPPSALLVRGFVEELTCTSADWLAHAPALWWPPTVACGKCDEGMIYHERDSTSHRTCHECAGTGRVPNPDPPPAGAQPIRKVTLTTMPPGATILTDHLDSVTPTVQSATVSADGVALTVTFDVGGPVWPEAQTRWPGITFVLPP